jgi:signal transduction histidine kinase
VHNVDGGYVELSTGTRNGKPFLTVSNSGPVIAAADVDRLFQPFQRLDGQRVHHDNGHGLGLSIVRAIAIAHGATIDAQPLSAGGISIGIVFPARTNRSATEDRDVTHGSAGSSSKDPVLAG